MFVFQGWGFRLVFKSWGWWSFRGVNMFFCARCHVKAARDIIRAHLDRAKWKESAFSVEQFRSVRWMLNTAPRSSCCPTTLRKFLTVTELAQCMHLKLVIQSFLDAGRRLRASARPRVRLSSEGFDKLCDFACVYANVLTEARSLASWSDEKEKEFMKAFYQKTPVCVKHFF